MAGKVRRKAVHLECRECKNRNYRFYRNREAQKVRLELSKYCKFCQKHTSHIEAR
jgi:large subunit ribosomal protein L33